MKNKYPDLVTPSGRKKKLGIREARKIVWTRLAAAADSDGRGYGADWFDNHVRINEEDVLNYEDCETLTQACKDVADACRRRAR